MPLLFIQDWLNEQALRALCWTFIHSLWQGLLAALAAGVILVSTRKSPALLRYNLLTALLFLFVLGAGLTFATEWRPTKASTPVAETVLEQKQVTITSVAETTYGPALFNDDSFQAFKAYFDRQAPLIVLVWGLFFLYHLMKMLAGLNYIHRLRIHRVEDAPEEWRQRLSQLSQQLGIQKSIRLLQSGLVKVPAVVGLFKPVILVPAGLLTNIPPACVEAVLLHELAHIRRKDFGVNLLQSVVEVVFFFNPALVWISSLIREEREACCDDVVLAATGDKHTYLQALVSFQESTLAPSHYAMALRSRNAFLLNRVRRMLTQENKRLTIMEKTILIAGLIGFSAFAFIPKAQETIAVKTPVRPQPAQAVLLQQPAAAATTPTSTERHAYAQPPVAVTAHKRPASARPVQQDTVPAKNEAKAPPAGTYPVKNVSTNVNVQDGQKVAETTATLTDGRVYRMVKVNDEVTEMSLDGKPLPKDEWNQHQGLWDSIERRQKEAAAKREQAMKQREEMRKQREAQLENRRAQQKAQRVQLEQRRRESENRRKQVLREQTQARAEARAGHEAAAAQRTAGATTAVGTPGGSNREVDVIVNELLAEKIITSRDKLSFTLTGSELIVNGQKQDAALLQRLKERLNIGAEDSFQYKRNGNSTTTTIVRN